MKIDENNIASVVINYKEVFDDKKIRPDLLHCILFNAINHAIIDQLHPSADTYTVTCSATDSCEA